MDLQTLIIWVAVFLLSAGLLLLISLFGIKSKSYDEAMAEQRQQYSSSYVGNKGQRIKKKYRKGIKNEESEKEEKESSDSSPNLSKKEKKKTPKTHPHVEFDDHPAICTNINPTKTEEHKGTAQVKSILVHREVSPKVSKLIQPVTSNHFEQIHPKDERELCHSREEAPSTSQNKNKKKKKQTSDDKHNPDKTSENSKGSTSDNVPSSPETKGKLMKGKTAKTSEIKDVLIEKKKELNVNEGKKKNVKANVRPIPENVKHENVESKNAREFNKESDEKEIVDGKREESLNKPKKGKKKLDNGEQNDKLSPNNNTVKSNEKNNVPTNNTGKSKKGNMIFHANDEFDLIDATQMLTTKENKSWKREINVLQQMSGDNTSVNINFLISLLRKTELSRNELQLLIDLLLNKQCDMPAVNHEWLEGPSDPIVKLKKQLAEREKTLQAEQEAYAGVAAKLKELRSELNARIQAQRQIEEANAQTLAERQALVARLQHSQDTYVKIQETLQTEKQLLNKQIQQLQGKLNEERHATRQIQEECNAMKNQRQQLEVAIARMSEKHQENEKNLKNQIGALHTEIQEQRNLSAALNRDLHSARKEAEMLRETVNHLEPVADQTQDLIRQLDETRRNCSDLEQRFSVAVNNAHLAEEGKNKAQLEVQRLQSEIARLHAQAKQQQDDAVKLVAQVNAELTSMQANANGVAEGDKARQVELLNLYNELSSAKATIQALQSELELQKTKNNKYFEESNSKVRLEEQCQYHSFLQRLFPEIKIQFVTFEKYLADFEKTVHDYLEKQKNDHEKRFSKNLEDLTKQFREKENMYTNMIEELENKIKENRSFNVIKGDSKVDGEIDRLEKLVTYYKAVVENTDILLRNLEVNVATKEETWRSQLQRKDEEITQLKKQMVRRGLEQHEEFRNQAKQKSITDDCESLKRVLNSRLSINGMEGNHNVEQNSNSSTTNLIAPDESK